MACLACLACLARLVPEKNEDPGFYFQVSYEEFEEMVPRLVRRAEMDVLLFPEKRLNAGFYFQVS